MALIDEATLALTSVVRLTLPAQRWPAVSEAVNRMDDAVWNGDERALRTELKNLRSAVIGTTPRPRPGDAVAPSINPLSFRTTDYVTRTPIRWMSIILIGAAVLLATLLVMIMVVLSVGDREPGGPAAAPTSVSAPPAIEPAEPAEESEQEPASGGGGIYLVSIGVLVLAGIGVFAVKIWRRRARGALAAERALTDDQPSVRMAHPSERVSPPAELLDAVDRAVAVLDQRRDLS